ncbi:MAG TPA: hypothetical protein VE262_10915 [Blastocatellia bacterium]|nr:hypothetical protein [Blastocatellia bacterium]
MPVISRSLLEQVKTKLESVRAVNIPEAKWQSTDWQVVKNQLRQLDKELDERDEQAVHQTLMGLLARLKYEKVEFRGEIGYDPNDKTQPMPPPVWELLNHIVDKINYSLTSGTTYPEK